jgi:hypothetical protein
VALLARPGCDLSNPSRGGDGVKVGHAIWEIWFCRLSTQDIRKIFIYYAY